MTTPVFLETACASIAIQKEDLEDLGAAYDIVSGIVTRLRDLRTEEEFKSIYERATSYAEEAGVLDDEAKEAAHILCSFYGSLTSAGQRVGRSLDVIRCGEQGAIGAENSSSVLISKHTSNESLVLEKLAYVGVLSAALVEPINESPHSYLYSPAC
ncbi:unnamed protein product [Leuciscus chuanchicus]